MARQRRRNLVLVLCLAVQVTVAPWLPCPCAWEEGAPQQAVALEVEGPHQDEAPCGRCDAAGSAWHCQQSSLTTRHADSWAYGFQKTRLPDGHALAFDVAVFHGPSLPSPDVHRLQVLLE